MIIDRHAYYILNEEKMRFIKGPRYCVLCDAENIINTYACTSCWDTLQDHERNTIMYLHDRVPDYIPDTQISLYIKTKYEKRNEML